MDPLVVEIDGQDPVALSSSRALLHLTGAYGLTDWLQLSLHVPVVVLSAGEELRAGGLVLAAAEGAALGDVALGLAAPILDTAAGFALGASVEARLGPDSDVLASDGGFGAAGRLNAELDLSVLAIAGSVGASYRPGRDYGTSRLSPELVFGAGVYVPIAAVVALGELYGAQAFRGGNDTTALETLLGLRWAPPGSLALQGGVAFGNSEAVGTPTVRGVLTVGWSPAEDAAEPARPPEPTPAPEPEPAPPPAPPPGPADRDGDQVPDESDRCPDEAEDRDGIQDDDGCPETDADVDTVIDPSDKCPLTPGKPESEGCPETVRVAAAAKQIRILERIEFDFDKATIRPSSFKVLEDVRQVIATLPGVRVRVEGHTDNEGDDAYNLDLSQRRAESVRAWLIEHGIEADRLDAKGHGEGKPIASNDTTEGRQTNRRVEFHLLDEKGDNR